MITTTRRNTRVYLRPPWFRTATVMYQGAKSALTGQGLMGSLSAGGLFIKTSHLPELRTPIRVRFQFAGNAFECEGEVIYLQAIDDAEHDQGFALRFTRMPELDQTTLRTSIESALEPYRKAAKPITWF